MDFVLSEKYESLKFLKFRTFSFFVLNSKYEEMNSLRKWRSMATNFSWSTIVYQEVQDDNVRYVLSE